VAWCRFQRELLKVEGQFVTVSVEEGSTMVGVGRRDAFRLSVCFGSGTFSSVGELLSLTTTKENRR
jgi:hypothetical protein